MNLGEASIPQYLSTCPSCDGVIDVSLFEPFSQVVCPHCAETVRVLQKFDHFTIQKELGEGGMSRVFDALDTSLGRHVALKILNRSYSKDSVRMASFEREAQLTASVTHPNVVKLYTVGRDQANFYIAMELVSGGSLEDRITKHGKISELEVLRVGRCIAEGLRAAAREGLIHRDIKPANILFTENDIPKLADFGLAIFHGHDRDDSGEIWATPHYVPPEKLREEEEDFRSDMYSLGATLFHALTGKPPYEADTNSIQELKVIKSQPVRLEDARLPFSPRTCEIINQLIALEPLQRFQNYDELIDAFRYAEGLLGYSEIGQKTRKIKKLTFVGTGVMLMVLLAILLRPPTQAPVDETNDEVELVHEGSGVTLAPGVESTSQRFLKGRQLLVQGNYPEALKAFQKLTESKWVKQPTLNWTRFNAALAAMLLRDQALAQKYFREIQIHADEGEAMNHASYKGFFAKLGVRMSQDLGLKNDKVQGSYQRDNEELMGYLAQGLAHWQFGMADQATLWLETYLNATPTEPLAWMSLYQPLAQQILEDDRRLQSSGLLKPSTELRTSKEAQTLETQIQDLLKEIKVKGLHYQYLQQSSRDLKKKIAELKLQEKSAEESRKKELLTRENLQFQQFMKTVPAVARGYDYQPVLQLLESLHFESDEVNGRKTSQIYLYSLAREFMDQVIADVNRDNFSGRLVNKDRASFQGVVSQMTYITTTVAFPQGQVTIPTDHVTAESLISMAQVFLEKEKNSTTYYRRLETLMVFARLHQMKDLSEQQLSQLLLENKEFKARWSKVGPFVE